MKNHLSLFSLTHCLALVLLCMAFFASVNTLAAAGQPPATLEIRSDQLRLAWTKLADGWHLTEVQAKSTDGKTWSSLPSPSGRHTILHIARKPAGRLVDLDKEGTAYPFYPAEAQPHGAHSVTFRQHLAVGDVTSYWSIDPAWPTDVHVRVTIQALKNGSFSVATPTLAVIDEKDLAWAMVPGNWYGTAIQPDFELSPGYSQGIPNRPYLVKESNTMTLCPLVSAKSGITLAVIPDPGSSADPWEKDKSTRGDVRLGLSTMNRYGELTPVVYSPILGGFGSALRAGQSTSLAFRYSVQQAPWFTVFRHAVMDIYRFSNLLSLQTSRESLSDRVTRLQHLLADPKASKWKTVTLDGKELGSNGEKTSDIGALWMLARTSGDPVLNAHLPFVLNYKLAQQQTAPGFFQWAATGEYPTESGFMAERGNWIEPLFTTYYTMLDLGIIALFEPQNKEVRERLRHAADKLIAWQHDDGSWDVAYDMVSHRLAFPRLIDLRPTWYGLLVASRVLGEPRYLAAAERGAQWYLKNAVAKGEYLGACGDALNIWDFTTGFGAQALLDLHAATGKPQYRDAAIDVAKVYATTIFTNPVPTSATKTVAGAPRKDWEITQVGLSVEHIRGTAGGGPIMLSSHAGLFVRIFELTGEQLFLDMARAAARGRHLFVSPQTGMSIYYWSGLEHPEKVWAMFPWHAEWQVGWITDYLLAEARLRSKGAVSFPSGFPTPKVGPQLAYGFAPGTVNGQPASLWRGAAVASSNPDTEVLTALSADQKTVFLIVLNQSPQPQQPTITFDGAAIPVKLAPWGIAVVPVAHRPPAPTQAAAPRRHTLPTVLCLGDSITAVNGGFGNYRKVLAARLAGKIEFVGSQQTATPAGPLYHDGYSGHTAEFLAQNIERLYTLNPADIVLIHAGHNHDAAEKPVPGIIAATRKVIATIQRINPRAKILLAQVITSGKLPKYEYLPELNRELAKLAGPGVIIVNQSAGFDPAKDTVADHVHPNTQGAEKIAAKWCEALLPLLK